MTWVKICGMTNLEDALTAVEAGADAVGFVFYEKSPRNISVQAARGIIAKLPGGVEKVGVFVHGGELEPIDVLLRAGLTGTQSYMLAEDTVHSGPLGARQGLEQGGWAIEVSRLPKRARFLMALPMNIVGGEVERVISSFSRWKENRPEGVALQEGLMDTFVLDSGDLRKPGGTGKTFDWEKAVPIAEGMRQGGVKLVVAGGLTPTNVGEAIGILKPWGVDVVSGVEARPGKKDPEKVRAFVRAVREMDRKTG
jgi:phosphoribosylanthranilate isomerase